MFEYVLLFLFYGLAIENQLRTKTKFGDSSNYIDHQLVFLSVIDLL